MLLAVWVTWLLRNFVASNQPPSTPPQQTQVLATVVLLNAAATMHGIVGYAAGERTQLQSSSTAVHYPAEVIYYKSQCPFDTARNYSSRARRLLPECMNVTYCSIHSIPGHHPLFRLAPPWITWPDFATLREPDFMWAVSSSRDDTYEHWWPATAIY